MVESTQENLNMLLQILWLIQKQRYIFETCTMKSITKSKIDKNNEWWNVQVYKPRLTITLLLCTVNTKSYLKKNNHIITLHKIRMKQMSNGLNE